MHGLSVTVSLPILALLGLGLISSVASELTIISEPVVKEAKIGDEVVLPCEISTDEKLIRLWTRSNGTVVLFVDGTPIYSNPAYSLESDKSSLRVKVTGQDTIGEFICKFNKNDAPELRHKIILVGPPTVQAVPESGKITVKEGEPLEFYCHSDSAPAPKITYTLNGEPLNADLIVNDKVQIDAATRANAGTYTCTADNGLAPTDSKIIEVAVHSKPEVHLSIQWLSSHEVELTCKSVSDVPTKSIEWSKGGNPIKMNDDFVISPKDNMSVLRINQATKENFDIYGCVAENDYGSTENKIEVSSAPIKPTVGTVVGHVDATLTLSTVSPAKVVKFLLSYAREGTNDYKTVDVAVSENEVSGGVGEQKATYKITGLTAGTTYNVKVVAVTEDDSKSPELESSFSTKPPSSSATLNVASVMLSVLSVMIAFVTSRY